MSPSLRDPAGLDAVLARPLLYVRGPIEVLRSESDLLRYAALSFKDALVICLLIVPFYPGDSPMTSSFKYLNWGSFAVGVAIIGIELGVFLAYRVGWKISLVATIANAMAALLLVGVGLLFFREHLSGKNVFGVGMCIAGLMLIMQR